MKKRGKFLASPLSKVLWCGRQICYGPILRSPVTRVNKFLDTQNKRLNVGKDRFEFDTLYLKVFI